MHQQVKEPYASERSVCHRTDGGMQKSLNKPNGGCLTILVEGGRRAGGLYVHRYRYALDHHSSRYFCVLIRPSAISRLGFVDKLEQPLLKPSIYHPYGWW